MNLSIHDFAPIFGPITPYVAGNIDRYAFDHRPATRLERDKAIMDMINAVYYSDLSVAGPARHHIWEKGWGENLSDFDPAKAGLELARPRYMNKHPIVRWQGDLYVPLSDDYEYNMLSLIQNWVFDKYLRTCSSVYEFGCGTGHNLFRVREVCPDAALVGLDWAESAVKFINLQSEAGAYGPPTSAHAERFDYFRPNPDLYIPKQGVGFITVASLEQTGMQWRGFMEFMLDKRPSICIHIEPIEEVLEPGVLLDHLSLEYFSKRGYLSGFLRNLGAAYKHEAEIVEVKRTGIGSKFIEGYTVVVWRVRKS